MATNASRRAREKRIRAKYRKKIILTGFIMLLIGLAAGYLFCMMTTETPEAQPMPTPVVIESTPQIIEATPQIIEATPEVIYVTPEATAEPVVIIVTPEPVVTAAPTVAPVVTAEPVVVLPEATQAPIVEPVEENTNVIQAPLSVVAATAEPVAAVPAEPVVTAAPQAAANAPVVVPYGEAITLDTQIKADGSARRAADAEAYETVNLTLQVDGHKGPTYFKNNYADSYMLQGNEAAVEFELTLNEYTGDVDIIPQNFLLITFQGETESEMIQGFQLMDTEIGGKTGIAVYSDTPTTLYKRYPYNKATEMVYMKVNTYNDGVESTYLFEIIDPNPEPMYPASYTPLEVGSKGDDVYKLQEKLIEMELLDDKADGKFGKKTGEAVKACQELLDMEPTGYADAALMNALFDIM